MCGIVIIDINSNTGRLNLRMVPFAMINIVSFDYFSGQILWCVYFLECCLILWYLSFKICLKSASARSRLSPRDVSSFFWGTSFADGNYNGVIIFNSRWSQLGIDIRITLVLRCPWRCLLGGDIRGSLVSSNLLQLRLSLVDSAMHQTRMTNQPTNVCLSCVRSWFRSWIHVFF